MRRLLLLVPLLAMALGVVGWQPKWPQQLWLWLAVNLGVAVLAEELLFRAWLQSALVMRLGAVGGVALTALLFGAAHAPFSPLFAVVAAVAGLGYGLVVHLSGRQGRHLLLGEGLGGHGGDGLHVRAVAAVRLHEGVLADGAGVQELLGARAAHGPGGGGDGHDGVSGARGNDTLFGGRGDGRPHPVMGLAMMILAPLGAMLVQMAISRTRAS